jgi:hypothetical protein
LPRTCGCAGQLVHPPIHCLSTGIGVRPDRRLAEVRDRCSPLCACGGLVVMAICEISLA